MLPNFLVLGACKAGTSSLYYYLKQHPQIYLSPQNELNYHAFKGRDVYFRGPRDLEFLHQVLTLTDEDYASQFEGVNGELSVGEVSPHTLYSAQAPSLIRQEIPDAKLIAILRQPVERAFSAFCHMLRDEREETPDFEEALRREERRIRDYWEPLWHYASMGFYARQLRPYFDSFSRDQIRVYLYDDFVARPLDVVQDMFAFLGVERDFVPDMSERYNVSTVPKSWRLYRLLTSGNPLRLAGRTLLPRSLRDLIKTTIRQRNRREPGLSAGLRRDLTELFRDDIRELETLLGIDLSAWLEPATPPRDDAASRVASA